MFFHDWQGVLRVLVVGTLAYGTLILMLRVSGKRTLSKMNAFDLIVTVALGSTLATVLLSGDVPLVEGILALALLVGLQFVITWLSVRSPRFQHVIKAEPTLLVRDGQLLPEAMRQQRVTNEEIHAALRKSGRKDLEGVHAVILETDGTLAVI